MSGAEFRRSFNDFIVHGTPTSCRSFVDGLETLDKAAYLTLMQLIADG